MDELNVMVTVTDVVGGLAISGMSSIDYPENGTGAVTTYTASGPDAGRAVWSLSGDDAGDFSISTAGVLSFNTSAGLRSPGRRRHQQRVHGNGGGHRLGEQHGRA